MAVFIIFVCDCCDPTDLSGSFQKRFSWYEVLVSLFFIVTMLVGGKTNQLVALGIYLCCRSLLVNFYKLIEEVGMVSGSLT